MKNVIKIDVNNTGYFTIENDNDGSNSIFVQFTNFSTNAYCEVFYGDTYYEKVSINDNGLAEIPGFCYFDNSNMRFRYHDETKVSGFIHIIGNAALYDDIVLKTISDVICKIGGTLNIKHVPTVEEQLKNLLTSVSEGKSMVAEAITEKGVETAADAEFFVMADNIIKISSGGYLTIDGCVGFAGAATYEDSDELLHEGVQLTHESVVLLHNKEG